MTRNAAPKSKFDGLVDLLNRIKDSEEVDELLLRRIKNDTEKLKKENPMKAFTILGIIACINGQFEESIQCHKNAIAYADDSVWPKYQYAVSLLNLLEFNEAYDILLDLHDQDKSDLLVLTKLIKAAAIVGKEREFNTFCDTWYKLTQKEHPRKNHLEDDQNRDKETLDLLEVMVTEAPSAIIEPDPDFVKSVDELVKDIEA